MQPSPDQAPETAADQREVVLERHDDVAVIRLNSPDRLNAATTRNLTDLVAALDACDADDDIRAVVLTGTGRAFCAGADISGGGETFAVDPGQDTGNPPPDTGGLVSLRIFRMTKPIISAINGSAAGVGVTMTLPTDVRIAADHAKFGFVFTRRGLVPEACSTWFLPRIVGISTAVEWTVGGKTILAGEALERGLVRELLPADEVLPRGIEIARELTRGTAPVSAALTRQLMWRMLGAPDPEVAHRAESIGIYTRGASADVRAGVSAFLAKEEPDFPDRASDGLPDLFT
ncbi:enoyl-CoA hydratase-related protein [Dietzia psychralcaliphila]|uniref:Enoyl-CoA hydratase n=1 Tax=Dietzia psychralcaliphila TaxID=139021 RepID=A0AAD0JVM2_9ACTN|nr:enoyl-CoA hydratase-related protein [Dietzia psychralcaliphila]AWH96383.1 enoyl-CoA hydratase [Dietzia psychralcaliphila]PTM90489.1 enoyl-CoA hydratase [Dietzia psychralcaliphila]